MLFFCHGNDDWSRGHRFDHRFVLVMDSDGSNKLAINDASEILERWSFVATQNKVPTRPK